MISFPFFSSVPKSRALHLDFSLFAINLAALISAMAGRASGVLWAI
jgi:hypothetical protein